MFLGYHLYVTCNYPLHVAPVSVAKRRAGNSVFCFKWQISAIVLLKLAGQIASDYRHFSTYILHEVLTNSRLQYVKDCVHFESRADQRRLFLFCLRISAIGWLSLSASSGSSRLNCSAARCIVRASSLYSPKIILKSPWPQSQHLSPV